MKGLVVFLLALVVETSCQSLVGVPQFINRILPRRPAPALTPTPSPPSPAPTCSSTQALFNGNCVACSLVTPYCIRCVSTGFRVVCTKCYGGLTVSNGVCVSPTSPAPAPPSPTPPPSSCAAINNCATCIPSGATGGGITCTNCVSGFVLDTSSSTATCKACDAVLGCIRCNLVGMLIECLSCATNRGLDVRTTSTNNQCPLCNSLIPGCLVCRDQVTAGVAAIVGDFVCDACAVGLRLATDGKSCI